jgi:hypothetical protein
MHIIEARNPMRTRMIRTPATGPEPANKLAYIAGGASGYAKPIKWGRWDRVAFKFNTEFKIDGFAQSQLEWYEQNTLVSATAMLRFLNTTTDLQFGFAVDRVTHFIAPDGTLGFICEEATFADNDAIFGGGEEIAWTYALSAWVLLFEPRIERPAPGKQTTIPARVIAGTRWTDSHVVAGSDRHKLTLPARGIAAATKDG